MNKEDKEKFDAMAKKLMGYRKPPSKQKPFVYCKGCKSEMYREDFMGDNAWQIAKNHFFNEHKKTC